MYNCVKNIFVKSLHLYDTVCSEQILKFIKKMSYSNFLEEYKQKNINQYN